MRRNVPDDRMGFRLGRQAVQNKDGGKDIASHHLLDGGIEQKLGRDDEEGGGPECDRQAQPRYLVDLEKEAHPDDDDASRTQRPQRSLDSGQPIAKRIDVLRLARDFEHDENGQGDVENRLPAGRQPLLVAKQQRTQISRDQREDVEQQRKAIKERALVARRREKGARCRRWIDFAVRRPNIQGRVQSPVIHDSTCHRAFV